MKNYQHVALLVGAVALCYHNSLKCGFVFDDMSAVRDNKDLRPNSPLSNLFRNDFWGTPMSQERSHKSYRPLCVLTFRLNYLLGGLDPAGYHLVNVVMHAVVCVQLYFFGLDVGLSAGTGFLASLLFAVHPVHTEAVTGVVGRAELLASVFYLLALKFYARSSGSSGRISWPPLVLSVALVALATLSKEQGITVVAVCCVYELLVIQGLTFGGILETIGRLTRLRSGGLPGWVGTAATRTSFLAFSSLLLLLLRIRVMGARLPVFTKFDNPGAAATDPLERFLTHNFMLPLNAWLLLSPSWLCCDWTMGTIPTVSGLADPRNLFTLGFFAAIAALTTSVARVDRPSVGLLFLSMCAFPFLPASNLFFPVGFVVAERVLYIPSMGFCLLVAVGFDRLCRLSGGRTARGALGCLAVLLVVSFALKTVARNEDWRDEHSIFMAGLRVNRMNAKLFNNVGHALENKKELREALRFFARASKVQPDDIGAHINVGRTFASLDMPEEAEQAYRAALALLPPVRPGRSYTARVAPNHLNVFINLGNLLVRNASRLEEADALLRTAISMRSDFVQAYVNRGDVLMRLNRTEEARSQYVQALTYEPENSDLHYNLGVVSIETGNKPEALRHFERALAFDSDHKQALLNSAILLQETNDPAVRKTAEARLLRVAELDPLDERVYFNLGMLLMDAKDFSKARSWFERAIEIKPDFRSALFNLALLLSNDMDLQLEAVPVLEQLLLHHPRHTNGLILLGDISINRLRDLDRAESCFRRILSYSPDDVQASHNLCVVHSERGDLLEAERCLSRVHALAPHEGYIQRHLSIVQQKIRSIGNARKRPGT